MSDSGWPEWYGLPMNPYADLGMVLHIATALSDRVGCLPRPYESYGSYVVRHRSWVWRERGGLGV